MSETLILVLGNIGSSLAVFSTLAWLSKKLISHWLDQAMHSHATNLQRESENYKLGLQKEAEQFRQGLQHENNREAKRLRAELNRLAMEHQARFNQLHNKVFVTIARLYRLIVNTQRTMTAYFSPYVPANAANEENRGQRAAEAWGALNYFFQQHEIYFDKETCRIMNQYLTGLHNLHIDFSCRNDSKNDTRKWKEVWDKLNTDISTLKRSLEDTFRKQIGIEPLC